MLVIPDADKAAIEAKNAAFFAKASDETDGIHDEGIIGTAADDDASMEWGAPTAETMGWFWNRKFVWRVPLV